MTGIGMRGVFGLLAVAAVSACGDDIDPPVAPLLDEPLFPGTTLIDVVRPQKGCTTGLRPTFEWRVGGSQQELVASAVFRSNFAVSNGRITNPASLVWFWHSGLRDSGRVGFVQWSDGLVPIEGLGWSADRRPDYGDLRRVGDEDELEVGATYAWAVWAWDDQGVNVVRSSTEVVFAADSVPTTGEDCAPTSTPVGWPD